MTKGRVQRSTYVPQNAVKQAALATRHARSSEAGLSIATLPRAFT